ncbi:MAG: 5'/3'-nucleotidase SurE [Candidatus Eisenbacteria bacterium]|uniref:5'-nucleotidase SurE n=1 Tax=Eiseniibacteriota bacterium TaxID=2212470 RepID=A0A933SDI3_UNCEI|nr:5'/3'-nucleotidase SurE [Candidatus Eisenbacteria bacterium]
MHILVTNDDGIGSPALLQLKAQLSQFGRVTIIAPDRNQSATSQALTLHRPLRIHALQEDVYSVDGTPTDCVLVAFHGKLVERPDLVVSGINHGPNMGEDVFYSGTVAAAIEGTLQGVPALAASLVTRQPTDFREPAEIVGRLLRQVLVRGLPPRMLLNVNFPFRSMADLAGVQFTRLGTRVYEDTLVRKVDPRGKEYYWIGGEDPVWRPEPGTDYHAVHAGFVSVTPMQLDLTDHAAIDAMESWSLGL